MNNKKVFFISSIASSVALSVMVSSFGAFANNSDTLSVTANRFQEPNSSILAPITIVEREQIVGRVIVLLMYYAECQVLMWGKTVG